MTAVQWAGDRAVSHRTGHPALSPAHSAHGAEQGQEREARSVLTNLPLVLGISRCVLLALSYWLAFLTLFLKMKL